MTCYELIWNGSDNEIHSLLFASVDAARNFMAKYPDLDYITYREKFLI